MRAFAPAEQLDITTRYDAGESVNALRIEYKCAPEAIQATLRAAGIKLRTRAESQRTPQFRQQSREALLQRLPCMRGPATDTPIERRLCDALMAAGIGFTTQSLLLDRYLVDIELHQAPIVLEADGAQHTLRDQRIKDAERDTALTAAGYRVFRFTGSKINHDAAVCVREVVAACGLTPDGDPVYDIRTRFAGPLHPRWTRVKFTCEQCGTEFWKPPSHRAFGHVFCKQRCYGDWLHEHPEVNTHRQRRSQRDWTGLAELYGAGMSIKQLGIHFGCSNRMITSAMRDQSIPVRPIGGRRVKGGFYAAGIAPS